MVESHKIAGMCGFVMQWTLAKRSDPGDLYTNKQEQPLTPHEEEEEIISGFDRS